MKVEFEYQRTFFYKIEVLRGSQIRTRLPLLYTTEKEEKGTGNEEKRGSEERREENANAFL